MGFVVDSLLPMIEACTERLLDDYAAGRQPVMYHTGAVFSHTYGVKHTYAVKHQAYNRLSVSIHQRYPRSYVQVE